MKSRLRSVKINNKKCSTSNKTFPDCHCNECYHNIIQYLGKKKGEVYLYTGKFAPVYLQNQKVTIESFFIGDEKTSTCEGFIKLLGGEGGQVDWIPREEIQNNLLSIKENN